MLASITVRSEHLGGPCDVRVEAELEPNNATWNTHTFEAMCKNVNELLAAMFTERDTVRFEEGAEALRSTGRLSDLYARERDVAKREAHVAQREEGQGGDAA